MEFMSEQHVSAMNALLTASDAVREACSQLPRPQVITYRLLSGPEGDTVYWTITFNDTVQFALTAHPSPDVQVTADWRETILSASAGRRGEYYEPPSVYEGDTNVLLATAPAMAAARTAAAISTDFPDLA
jgi:hypothetical protein